ncbi:MAG: aminotransferase class V-fold PLP-dependent enzyme [Bacteroidota bacterium]
MLSPGPVPVPDFVSAAMQKPMMHHRSEGFAKLYENIRSGLRYLFQTEAATGTVIGSGTYGVEMAMYSLFRPGERVVILNMGKFSDRWVEYGEVLGLEVQELKRPWGKAFGTAELMEAVKAAGKIQGIILTHCETSTGVVIDLEEMAFALRSAYPDLLIMVDGITTIGAIPFYFDAWGIDAAIIASQKALMSPAGIAAYALSERAQSRLQATKAGDFRNLYYYVQTAAQNAYPYTAPVQLLYAVEAALAAIFRQGLPSIWNQVHQCRVAFHKGVKQLGAEIYPESPSESLTAISWEGVDLPAMQKGLAEAGYWLAGGQAELKGKILRITHFGGVSVEMMEAVVAEMKKWLNK